LFCMTPRDWSSLAIGQGAISEVQS
jgi:hypothetical protein